MSALHAQVGGCLVAAEAHPQLDEALEGSPELSAMLASPVYSREDQTKAVTALAKKITWECGRSGRTFKSAVIWSVPDSPTPIQPLIVGESAAALRLRETLRARGILISAIRPPTFPPGSARLRITFSAAHSAAQVDRLLDALVREVTQIVQAIHRRGGQ